MSFLLDTNHASAVCTRKLALADWRQRAGGRGMYVCPPVIGELWYMVLASERISENRADLAVFLAEMQVAPFGTVEAEAFGSIRLQLRKIGRKIPQIDAQIGAIALVHGLTVLTDDRHFDSIVGVDVENWLR